jgi:multidrug resistance efflux pump
MKRIIIIPAAAMLIVAGTITGCTVALPGRAQTPVPSADVSQPPPPKPVTVEGTVQPAIQAKLSFQTGGRVRSAPPHSGFTVQAGDLLSALDTTDLELALQAAVDDLALARAQEAQAQEDAVPEQMVATAAGVRASQARLDEVLAGPRDAERRGAEAAVEQATARLRDAMAREEQLAIQPRQADIDAASSALEKAQRDAEAAAARLAQLEQGGTAEEVAIARAGADKARADLGGAEAALAQIKAPPAAADVTTAQTQLDQARTRLAQLQDAPRATPQDYANAQLAVEQARTAVDKARADAGDANLVGPGKPLSRQAADAAIRQAEIQLQTAQNNLDKLRASAPSDWDFRLAQQSVEQAQAAFDRVTRGATAQEIARAEAQVQAARAGLESAQARLVQVERGATDADLVGTRGALAAAQAGAIAAKAKLEQVLAGPSDEERQAAVAAVAAAAGDLRSAEAKRDQLLAGATRADQEQARSALAAAVASDAQTRRGATEAAIQVASARTKRAETAVEQARAALDRASLRAPFDGTVTAVSVRQGETIASGTTAITIADLSHLQIETRDLDESVVARVREGQDVTVLISALGRATLPGKVVRIANQPSSTASTSDVYYTATIELTQAHPNLRWGMTTKVEFR